MKIQRLAAITLLVCTAGAMVIGTDTYASLAQTVGPERRSLQSDRGGLLEALDLSPKQIEQLEAVRRRYQEPMRQNQQALRQARQELKQLMEGAASEQSIRDKYRQIESLKQQGSALRLESMLSTREILTLEQRRQMTQQLQNRRNQRRDRPGRTNF